MYLPLAAVVTVLVAAAVLARPSCAGAGSLDGRRRRVSAVRGRSWRGVASARGRGTWTTPARRSCGGRQSRRGRRMRVRVSPTAARWRPTACWPRPRRNSVRPSHLAPADPVAHVRLGAVLARQNKIDAAIAPIRAGARAQARRRRCPPVPGRAYAMRRDDARRRAALRTGAPRWRRATLNCHCGSRPCWLIRATPPCATRTRAVTLVEQAMRATGRRDVRALEVLSVALGSAFRWTEAAATAREAAALARARGDARRAAALRLSRGGVRIGRPAGLVPRR